MGSAGQCSGRHEGVDEPPTEVGGVPSPKRWPTTVHFTAHTTKSSMAKRPIRTVGVKSTLYQKPRPRVRRGAVRAGPVAATSSMYHTQHDHPEDDRGGGREHDSADEADPSEDLDNEAWQGSVFRFLPRHVAQVQLLCFLLSFAPIGLKEVSN